MLFWLVAAFGLVAGLIACLQVRALSRRVTRLTQSYWELRYDLVRLRAEVAPDEHPPEDSRPAAPPVGFVPLSSLKSGGKPDPSP